MVRERSPGVSPVQSTSCRRARRLFAIPGGGLGSGQTRMMTVSPDLATAITLSTPIDRKSLGRAIVWDLVRARKLGEIETDPGALLMSAAAVSPEGKRLTVAATRVDPGKSQKLTITTWDLESGKQLCREEVAKFSGQAKLEAADESTVLVADTSGKLRRLNIERGTFGEDLEPVSRSPIAPSPIVFSRDRTRFAVGVTEGTELHGVRIHEWPSGKVLHTFKCNSSQISASVSRPMGNAWRAARTMGPRLCGTSPRLASRGVRRVDSGAGRG